MDSLDFSHQEIERATRYHRPRYLSSAADLASSTAVLAVLQWAWAGPWRLVDGLGWAGAAAAYTGLVSAGLLIVQLPVSFWRGHLRERRYGFSTQGAAGWAWDRAKGEAIGLVVLAGFWVGLVGLARALPSGWPAVAAAIVALLVFVVSFLSPVVLEPIFNRFRPLEDRRLADALLALAGRAGVPVREVLVADASRRTTKLNAYVSGIGRTRRVVLYDTLLDAADEGQLQLVVAHELGHRRERHVAKFTAAAMLGAAVWIVALWAVLGSRVASPRDLPIVLLVSTALRIAALPLGAAVSRRYERAADRFSLELTRDLPAYERAHLTLARSNLGDLEPPRLVYWLVFSHPTTPERLAFGRAWAAAA
ncbi:MAG TPA: M48 family metalloprotease [Gaiellaceae bacterium]|nr:M48 family metalloprotease [Gaiellaceae bacterium]